MVDPIPFEHEHPEAAAFMQRVFAAGGRIRYRLVNPYNEDQLIKTPLTVTGLTKYSECPCGSGNKVKFCHPGLASL